MVKKMMQGFIKGESFPFAITTDKMVASESFTHVIRKHHCSPPSFPSTLLPHHKSLKNNKCCKCSSKSISFPRRRINGLTTIMFLASYLLIFTVVTTSFVTSQPVVGTSVTNLQARNKLMMKMKTATQKAEAAEEATIPIQISTPSSSSSYPSFSSSPPTSSFYSDDDSTKNGNVSYTADVPTGKLFAKHKSPQKSTWSTVLPPLGSLSSKLSLDQVGNFGKGKERTAPTAAEFSVNNIGNHADSPLSSSSSSPQMQTVTEKYIGQLPLNNGLVEEKHASSRNNEMEIKVGLARDKGKVMVTDDVKGYSLPFPSSSKVNPVSSSFSSGNSHAPLLPTAATNDDDGDVDKAVVKEKKGIKVNIITLKDKEEEMEDKRKSKILLHSKLNLLSNLNKSQRFMSTTQRMMEEEGATTSPFQKQQDEMIVTTTTASSNRQKEGTKTASDVRGDDGDRGEYANEVNNHVNFVDENYNQPTTEIQAGFDTDYSNKRRDFTTTDSSPHESPSNGSSKSTTSSSPDSSSTDTPGNSVKSTRHVAEKMNISLLYSSFPEVPAVDNVNIEKNKEKENEKEEEEDKVHQEKNKSSDNVSQSYNHIYDFSNDSPAVVAVLTTGDEEEGEDNWKSPSTKTSPLLMNKWITTLVKLSQCRANCLDQAGIHQWDSQQSDLLDEEHQLGSTSTDNQKEGAIAATTTTITAPPNWSDLLNKEQNLYSSSQQAVTYLEQMKESKPGKEKQDKKRSTPLSTTVTTTTPQRTIKVTPSKSMKYYELSNCQQLCRNNFPIHQPNLIVHENNGYYDDDSFNFPNNKAEQFLTGEDKKENKEQVNRSNNDNIISSSINDSKSSSAAASPSSTPAGNKNNGNNGSNNNNTDNNDEKNIERTYPKEKITTPVEKERSSWVADRKTNNNNYHSLIPQEKVENQDYRHPQQHHFPYSMSSSTSSSDSERKSASGGGKYDGGSNDLQPLMKLLAIEQVSQENNNKKEPHSWRSATGLLNNLKTFPSDPGLKVRQLSLREGEEKKDKDEDGVASTFSSTPTLQLSLSWPKPTSNHDPGYEDAAGDDHDKDKNNKPEEAFSAQVKDKKGIHFGGGDGGRDEENKRIGARSQALGTGISLERNSSSSKKPITLVYSIILEESWDNNGSDGIDGNLDMYPYARRWQLIDQIVARTTTQISLPLTIVQEKVPSEQEKNGEEKNNKGRMSLNEQKVVRTKRISPSGSTREEEEEEEEAGALEQKKGEIIKVNENKKNYLLNGMVEERMMLMTPLLPTPLQQSMDEQPHHQHNLLKKKTADPPSKVTVRVLAVSRQGLEKVYSTQVKVNNSFRDYQMNEHDHNQQKVYRENLNQTTEKASWTHAASDSHNNIMPPISSSPIAFRTTTKFEGEHDDEQKKKDDVDGEEVRRMETGNQKKEVDKLGSENEKKVEEKKKAENEKSGNFNESNENSNQILVFPSEESLRQTLGGGRGLSGELKVKKLMSRLKQKKKSENEVDSRVSKLVKPAGKEVERNKVSQDDDQDDYREEKDGNINRMNGVSSPKKKISLTDEGVDQVKDEERENWGLHTVSMIYQKFLVVTQVTWDYPGEKDDNQGIVNILANNGMTRNDLGNESNLKFAETTGKNNISTESPLSSGGGLAAPNKKWKGCGGNRASNSNDGGGGNEGVDGGNKEQQLNFLLSWEIFGGGLRGNLVTDTCSASISLWPDTAYIIQVGLITPNKEDDKMKRTKTNGQDSAYFPSYLAALQSSYNSRVQTTSSKKGNISSNHVQDKILEKSSEVSVENSEIVHEHGGGGSTSRSSATIPTTTDDPSSFDPLVLPESISFPFDGEPKVTIKSERILVNTTRASGSTSSKTNFVDDDDTNDDVTAIIRNQDKVTPGNSQSNNNFLPGKKETNKWYSNSLEQPVTLTKKNNVGDDGESSESVGVSGGINDKVNVSPITITRNGHFEENGPAFEEQSVFAAEEENDQPEQESPHHPPPPPPPSVQKQAAAVNEDDTDQQYNSSVWDDDNDEDEATDQDESLFARSLAHQNHHLHQKHSPSKRDPPPTHYNNRPVSLPQAHTQVLEEVEAALKEEQQQQQHSSTPPVESKKFHSYMTVNSFYQSLYALSRNVLKLNHRYPHVITITNEGDGGGNKNGNGSSTTSAALSRTGGGDSNVGPLLIGEFTNSNQTGYLFTTTHTGGDDEDSSGVKGKLYTLFVILVISFVVFLFVVAIVGFCVLTSSIKENYKYFVPKKVRVWTTVGQLLKGHNSNQEGGASSSSSSGGGGGREGFLFKDSAEGSFYPRRLQEEPDYEFDDNEDVDPDDEDDDEEEVTSIAETDDEEEDGGGGLEESECDCQCRYVIDNESVEEDENSFSLNERYTSSSSSDRVKLIRDGEENSVELMACIDENDDDEYDDNVEGESERNSCSYKNSKCYEEESDHHHHHPHHSSGNCDNNNPCYRTIPGGCAARTLQSAPPAKPSTVKSSPVAAALSSLKKNFHRVSSSSSAAAPSSASSQQHHQLQHRQQQQRQHHPHCHHYQNSQKRKSDTRIDVTGSSSGRHGRNLLSLRQEGYY